MKKPTGQLYTFPFNAWLEGTEAVDIAEASRVSSAAARGSESQRFKMSARTSDLRFAGTDSNVYMELWGDKGAASGDSAIHLNNAANNFERGQMPRPPSCPCPPGVS